MGKLPEQLIWLQPMIAKEVRRLPLVQGIVPTAQVSKLTAAYDPYRLAPFVRDMEWLSALKPRLPLQKRAAACLANAQHGTLWLEFEGIQVLIDPGDGVILNEFNPAVIALTHAHADHSGALLEAAQKYPQAAIVTTPQTYDLLQLLPDGQAQAIKLLFEQRGYIRPADGSTFRIAGINFRLYPAGHLLGAAMIDIEYQAVRVLVTGDFALRDLAGFRGAVWPLAEYDTVFMESTHGWDFEHPTAHTLTNDAPLIDTCTQAIQRGSTRVIFLAAALGDAQAIYGALAEAQSHGLWPQFTIRLAGKAAQVAKLYAQTDHTPLSLWSSPLHRVDRADYVPQQSIVVASGAEPGGIGAQLVDLLKTDTTAAIVTPQAGAEPPTKADRYAISLHASFYELFATAAALTCAQVAFYHAPRLGMSPAAELLEKAGRRTFTLSETLQSIGYA